MATKYLFDFQAIKDVANAIRTKGGFTDQMRVKDMPEYIANIEGGGVQNYMPLYVSDNTRLVNAVVEE